MKKAIFCYLIFIFILDGQSNSAQREAERLLRQSGIDLKDAKKLMQNTTSIPLDNELLKFNDNKNNENLNNVLNSIYLKNDNLQNKIYFKNLLNDAIKSYAG